MSKFLIACGGTGGHLSPGIALAESLIERGHKCTLAISEKDVDSRLISKYPNLDFVRIPGKGFSLRPLSFFKSVFGLMQGVITSLNIIRREKPDLIVGFGGFITFNVVIAGYFLGCPIVLHEANRKAGKAVRLLSAFARRVYLPPGVQLKSLPPKTIRHLGYPVRREIRYINRRTSCRRLGLNPDSRRLLVLGGSQGASVLNKWVLDNFERLGSEGIDVYCVTGLRNASQGKLKYISEKGEESEAIFVPFADNMSEVLSVADLVISRAGAGSIAEFSKCGLPSILVPYPHATDNHQLANARCLERQGGCIVLEQKNMDKLFDEVTQFIFNDWLLDKFQQNLKRIDSQNPLFKITNDLEVLAREEEPFLKNLRKSWSI